MGGRGYDSRAGIGGQEAEEEHEAGADMPEVRAHLQDAGGGGDDGVGAVGDAADGEAGCEAREQGV